VERKRVRQKKGHFPPFVAGCKFREGRGLILGSWKKRGKRWLHGQVLEEMFFEMFLINPYI